MTPEQREALADLIDQVVAPGGRVGARAREWPYDKEFAIKRFKLGASLLVYYDEEHRLVRYTLHHIGCPYVVSADLGSELANLRDVRTMWIDDHIGKLYVHGTIHCIQYKGTRPLKESPK